MENNERRKITFDEMPNVIAEIRETVLQLARQIGEMKVSDPAAAEKGSHVPIGTKRACEITGKARNTLYRYTAHGLIPCYKRGKQIYFFEDELLEWVRSGKCETVDEQLERTGQNIAQLTPRYRR